MMLTFVLPQKHKDIEKRNWLKLCVSVPLWLIFFSAAAQSIRSGNLLFETNNSMQTKITSLAPDTKPLMNDFSESEYLTTRHDVVASFKLISKAQTSFSEKTGSGMRYVFIGENGDHVKKILVIKSFDQVPDFVTLQVHYINSGRKTFHIIKWTNSDYQIISQNDSPAFWSFQGGSSGARKDWMVPVDSGFFQRNYMGMNGSDYGGGIPLTDLWRRDGGISIASIELKSQLLSFPVEKNPDESFARMGIEKDFGDGMEFKPGDTINTTESSISIHTGDCFTSLRKYAEFMQLNGVHFPKPDASAFEPMWCAWGYERDFTLDEIIGTLPKVKELGIKWATLDDGYQISMGDWQMNPNKFPNGIADMRRLTDAIHAAGLKAQIWYSPLAVFPRSALLREHPNVLLRNEDGSPQFISWWDSWYMSPTDSFVLAHTRADIKMFLHDWNFDGLKLDGQHLNACPPDYADHHNISDPVEAPQAMPDFFQMIYTTAIGIKPDALVQLCPCGDCINFYNLQSFNQSVASDPESSWQIRSKGKVYKAVNPAGAYFGDHVELSDGKNDFASQFGVGAVLGTKFTYPKDNHTQSESFLLTPDKEKIWKHWFQLYNQKMLSKENYLGNLYDLGYDKPEAHVIAKGDTFFYAFYSDEWNGAITLKGLNPSKRYEVNDYVNNKKLGVVDGLKPTLLVSFTKSLLVEVYTVK